MSAVAVGGIPASLDVGATVTLTARATYSDGSTRDCTSAATWSSSDTAIATVSSAGVLSAVAQGDAQIRATCAGTTGAGNVRVTRGRVVVSVAVAGIPSEPFYPGDTSRLTATATYSDGTKADCTSTGTWASSGSSVASVSAAGLLSAVAPGDAEVRASCDDATGIGKVTVSALPPPPVARLFTSYDDRQVEAVWMVAPIWFDASRSTGVGLKYMIEFGDGQTSSESIIAHIPNVDPRRNNGGRLTVTDRWGRLDSATAQYLIFGFGFYGPYESWLASSTGQLNLAQDRSDPTHLSGRYLWFTPGGGYVDKYVNGTVGADRSVHLVSTDGTVELTGYYNFPSRVLSDHRMILRVRGGAQDGQTIEYYLYDGP